MALICWGHSVLQTLALVFIEVFFAIFLISECIIIIVNIINVLLLFDIVFLEAGQPDVFQCMCLCLSVSVCTCVCVYFCLSATCV